MLNLKQVREFYPEYNDMTDYELTSAIHQAQYPDVPFEQFASQFGGPAQEDPVNIAVRDYNAANPDSPITADDIRNKDRSGLWGSLKLLGEGIADAITDQFPEDLARIYRGGEISPEQRGMADDIIAQQEKDRRRRIPSLQEAQGDTLANSLYQGPQSVATSMATGIGGAALGGAAGSVIPGVGSLAGSMVGGATMSGAAFYRMAKDQFVDEVQKAMEQYNGRPLTQEEAIALNDAIDQDATSFGAWEAGPEAVSQLFTIGLVGGLGGKILKSLGLGGISDKIAQRALTRIPTKMAAEVGEEELTEGATFMGQEGIRQDYNLRQDAPTIGEFVEDQAGPVAVGSLLQLGAMGGAKYMRDRYNRYRDAQNTPTEPTVDEQAQPTNKPQPTPPSDEQGTLTPPAIYQEAIDPDEVIYEDAFINGAVVSPPGRSDIPRRIAIESGREEAPIDLLGLPRQSGVFSTLGQEQTGIPFGGSIVMGTDEAWGDPIVMGTTENMDVQGPITTPYPPMPALPSGTGMPPSSTSWTGGRSQLSYPWPTQSGVQGGPSGPSGGSGGILTSMGQPAAQQPAAPQEAPAPTPTQAQITNIQEKPRADVVAPAQDMGMPAPDAIPQEAQKPSAAPQAQAVVHQQAMPQQAKAPIQKTPVVQPSVPPVAPQIEEDYAKIELSEKDLYSFKKLATNENKLESTLLLAWRQGYKDRKNSVYDGWEKSPYAKLLTTGFSSIGRDDISRRVVEQYEQGASDASEDANEVDKQGDKATASKKKAVTYMGKPLEGRPVMNDERESAANEILGMASSKAKNSGDAKMLSDLEEIKREREFYGVTHDALWDRVFDDIRPYAMEQAEKPAPAKKSDMDVRKELLASVPAEDKAKARRMKTDDLRSFVEDLQSKKEVAADAEEQAARRDGLEQGNVRAGEEPVAGNAPREERGGAERGAARAPEEGQQQGRRSATVKVPNRAEEAVTYELMEADDVQPSHLPEMSFQKNPRYELENERRYHDEPASQRKVLDNASRLDPDFLMESVDANHGAPVIDQNGNVIGGNGRAMSVRYAYEKFPERTEAYRRALRSRAAGLGLSPDEVDAMRRPVLVRRLDNSYDAKTRQELVTALNDTFTDSKNARASGKSRGDRLSERTLSSLAEGLSDYDSLRQYFDSPESSETVELLIRDGVIQNTERNAYLGADGLLNPDGKRIVEEAIRGRIAKSYDALASLPGPVVAKIDAAIPNLLIAESFGPQWDITQYMSDAIDLLAEHKASGIASPEVFLNQMDMLKGQAPKDRYSLAAQQLFKMALEMKKNEFAKAFQKYAAQAKISPEAGALMGVSMRPEIAREAYLGINRDQPQATRNEATQQPSPGEYGTASDPNAVALANYFSQAFMDGKKFSTIVEARREAAKLVGGTIRPTTKSAKTIDEAIELGVVMAARQTVSDMRSRGASDAEIFRALVDLYQRQPRLNVRTSTSVSQQAYSTPAPISFIASRIAGIDENTKVFEPTAGNGMLLIEASPENTTANELNEDRAERLRSQGFTVSERDAVEFAPSGMDVVIENPPFGRVRGEDGQMKEFSANGLTTKEVDHAIVARSLGSLKRGGRAVLIIGGKQGDEQTRSKKYRAADQVAFWNWLFKNYNVLDHFSIDGKLYERQGASYPIDVIVLENSGPTEGRLFPGANLPRQYKTFDELEGVLNEQMVGSAQRERGDDGRDSGVMEDGRGGFKAESDRTDRVEAAKADSGRGRAGRDDAPVRQEPGERRAAGVRDDRREEAGEGRVQRDMQRPGESRRDASPRSDVRNEEGRGAAEISAAVQQRQSEERSARDDAGRLDRRSDAGDVRPGMGVERQAKSEKKPNPARKKMKETVFQVPYEPTSEQSSMGTLVPRNMATAVKSAMTDLEKKHGEIDKYVADQLGYPVEDLGKYFAAEQVDALGMAISNISEGSGFIIGDQTGIGKGRVNAGIIRWAKRQGLIPVFVTMKPDLYADMVRDLSDIGMDGFNPLPTNSGLSGDKAIQLPDGRMLTTRGKNAHEKILNDVMKDGMGEYDAIFTTYDQLNPVNKRDTFRRKFLMGIARNAVFILDESHNAGGQATTRKKASDADDRAQFVRKMLKESNQGAFYSSATYAKRPDVMSLYFKTDMRYAADDMNQLAEAIEQGGIPMQQVVAAELTETGQYLRRERSFEGAEVQTSIVKIDKSRAEKTAEIMRAILVFDEIKKLAVAEIDKKEAGLGGRASDNQSTGEKGASSTNFTSVMHNLISQSLLAQKLDAVVDAAVSDVEKGEKVVITLANTMGSMIGEYAENNDISVDDPINLTFNDMFKRYLEKSRMVTEKNAAGQKVERRLTDQELGPDGVKAYKAALKMIDSSDFGDLPVSVIDMILYKLRDRGINAGEITGRTELIDYSTNPPTYQKRTTGPSDRIKVVDDFNSGKLDVVILNQSGSTGISLHASERFKDQRRRNMIIAQPEANIDVFMQTLGRVFRTGQVVPPTYQLVMSDLPAEKRPAAVLAKKMSSLNANTTASKDSDTTFKNIPDFMNKYGDRVAFQVMQDNPTLHKKMGMPLKDFSSHEDAMRKVTGRIPLLTVKEQGELYRVLESEYDEYIKQLEAMGGTGLEAKSLPLDAKLISEEEIVPAKDVGKSTPFASAAMLGTYDVKKLGKPWPSSKVREMVAEAEEPDLVSLRRQLEAWHSKKSKDMSVEAEQNQRKRLESAYNVVTDMTMFKPGTPVMINAEDTFLEGIVLKLYHSESTENPLALSAWKMDIALPDPAKKITIPLSQTVRQDNPILISLSPRSQEAMYDKFDSGQNESREKAYILTGNILAAAQKVKKGNVITFQDNKGNTIPGILLPKDTDPKKIMGNIDVSLTPDAAISFLKELPGNSAVKTADKNLVISYNGASFSLTAPSSKAKGAQYFLNGAVLEAAGSDFVKLGQSMVINRLSEEQARGVMEALSNQGYGFIADNNREAAREIVKNAAPGTGESPMASKKKPSLSGKYLPPRKEFKRAPKAAIKRVVDKLAGISKNAAKVEVVDSVRDLPQSIRDGLPSVQEDQIEGLFDPVTGKVWLIANNLDSVVRAVEVWMHENMVHHGLRSAFTPSQRRVLLNKLWQLMGGMRNKHIKNIAKKYGLDPRSDMETRFLVVEETLAALGERRARGLFGEQEKSMWRKIVDAFVRAWRRAVKAITGYDSTMDSVHMERLLDALQGHVIYGDDIVFVDDTNEEAANRGFMFDENIYPAIRTDPPPKKTQIAYKMFRVMKSKPGQIFPLFVLNNTPVEMGVWLDAEVGQLTNTGKVKSSIGNLAYRPGWHAGDTPIATHIGDKENKTDKKPSYRSEDHVWAEVEVADDVDWQTEANRRAERTKAGKIIPRTAHITDQIPKDGMYRYKTNPNMTGTWIISGSMKVNRILSDAEVERINKEAGVADLPRKKPFEAEKYGFAEILANDGKPLASLASRQTSFSEAIASGVRMMRKVMGRGVSEDVEEVLSNREMGKLIPNNDMGLAERLFKLPHWVAKDHKGFAKVYERQLRRVEDRSSAIKSSLEKVPLLFDPDSKKRLNDKELEQLTSMIWKWDGKQIGPLNAIEKFNVVDQTVNGRDILEMNPEYRRKFKEWLAGQKDPDRVKQAFLQVRESLDDAFLMAYNRMAEMSDLAETDLEMYRTEFGNIDNYFPHQRKGKYYVVAKEDGETVFRKHFDVPLGSSVREEWAKIVTENRKKYPGAQWSNPREAQKLPDDILGAPIDPEAMEQIISAAAGKLGDSEQAERIRSTLLSGVADILKARGFGAHGIHRQNIPGFETQDVKGVLYSYMSGLNGWLTKMEAASDFAKALGKIDATKQPRLWEYASQYTKDMLRNSDQIDRIAGNIKSVAFAWYLGGNIKTAVVNLTQNAVVGVPRLQQYVSGGAAQWLKGAMDTIGLTYSGGKINGAKRLTADESAMLKELYGNSTITDAYMEEVRGQVSDSPATKIWDKFTRILGMPMSRVEIFNRASLALAAYRAARAGAFKAKAMKEYGLEPGQKMNHEQAKEFASMLVRDTHFEYGRGNQPEFLRSNTAGRAFSPIFTFRSFGANILNLWWRALLYEGNEGRAFVAKSLGATIALGGLTSFPFYATMAALCAAASGDDEDWTTKVRDMLPENNLMRDVVCYGLPSLAGVNIGGSMRMETPFTEGFTRGETFKDAMTESIGSMLGIPYDLAVNRPSKYLEARRFDNNDRAIEALVPVFVSNAMTAYRLATEGQTTLRGRPINSPGQPGARKLSTGEAIGKALGFQPTSSTKSYESYVADKRRVQVRSDLIDEFVNQAKRDLETHGRTYMMRELRKRLQEWNAEKEAEGKLSQRILPKDVIRRLSSRMRENRPTASQRQRGKELQSTWGI